MSTTVRMERSSGMSPRRKARIVGGFYLLTIVAGIFAEAFVSGRLVVDGDAVATATNILAHKELFQWGFAGYLVEMACQISMTALFYELLKPAGKSISLLAAFIGFAGCIIKTFSRVFFIAPLFVLGGAHYLSVFSTEQLQALSLLLLKVNDHGAATALVFFGFYALLTGFLIVRSHVSASDSGRAGNLWRLGLADLSVSTAGLPSVSLRRWPRHSWGGFTYRLASRVRSERTAME